MIAVTDATRGKMRSIEAARAIAAICVALMHCGSLMRVEHFTGHVGLGGIFSFGYVGVDFFFVLSGFIIAYVHFGDIGQPSALPRYLWRRLTRIYPIFWVSLVLAIIVIEGGRLVIGKPAGLDIGFADIFGTLLLLPSSEPKYVGVAWSLQYEIIFYLAFCALVLHRNLGVVLFAIWCLYVGAVMAGVFPASNPGHFASPHCLQFAMGVVIGVLARKRNFPFLDKRALAGAVIALVMAIFYDRSFSTGEHGADGRIVLGAASALLLWVLVELEKLGSISTPRWLARMGAVSYSIYLTHILFINLVFFLLTKAGIYHRLPEVVVFFCGLAGALLAASAIGFFIELPLVSRLKNLSAV